MFLTFFGAIVFSGYLLSFNFAQPGVTFDEDIPCWINVTSSGFLNTTYSEEQQEEIKEYLQQNMIVPAIQLPFDEQLEQLLESANRVQQELTYVIAPPQNIADLHFVGGGIWLDPVFTFNDLILQNSTNYYLFALNSFGYYLRVCVDGETVPDHSFIIRHAMEISARGFLGQRFASFGNLDEFVNAAGLALANAWEDIVQVDLDYEMVAQDVIQGLLNGYQSMFKKVLPEDECGSLTTYVACTPRTQPFISEQQVQSLSESVATSILELAHGGFDSTDVSSLVMNVTEDLEP
eukprot:TRINITY_DN9840_c0_g2_i2.p1 TRINITY_DN9840_c0_g2~~TRINITY_DN9840_c0_g2_i2.p1  ORF type:complete len:292 (-),score=28.57 TRINITY_DN9840_c0_g2_i2:82-957(-)